MKKAAISVILIIVILISGCSIIPDIFEDPDLFVPDEYKSGISGYYFDRLSDIQKEYYICYKYISENREKAPYVRGVYSDADGKKALSAFICDNPGIFWLENKYTYIANQDKFSLSAKYIADDESISEMKSKLSEKRDEILKDAPDGDFEKAIYIHDYLIENVSYLSSNEDEPLSHTVAGALLENKAVCDGYSLAFAYLLSGCGVDCITVFGKTSEDGITDPEGHAWNIAYLSGNYYSFDITFDDRDESSERVPGAEGYILLPSYDYFGLCDSEMNKDHIPSPDFIYPECIAEDGGYYSVMGYYAEKEDDIYGILISQFSENLEKGYKYARIKCSDNITDRQVSDILFVCIKELSIYNSMAALLGDIHKGCVFYIE